MYNMQKHRFHMALPVSTNSKLQLRGGQHLFCVRPRLVVEAFAQEKEVFFGRDLLLSGF